MLFDTLDYWLFFAIVLLVLAALRPFAAKCFLIVASYVFYACWDIRFVLLLAASTLANWLFGLWIDRNESAARKRAVVAAIVFNLTTLAFFKYFDFFMDTFARLTRLDPGSGMLHIVLPVGISFFTFEGIAYAVDVYRRDLAARRNVLDFALFISFFPHLIAGPIIRPIHFFPQTGKKLQLADEDARWGLREILKGLFKKIALPISTRRSPKRIFIPRCGTAKSLRHGSAFWHFRCKSISIFRATPTSHAAARGCWDSSFHRISSGLICHKTSPISGDAGTFRCHRGCATICIFRSAAIDAARCARTSIC
jgi:hypothetical protein